MDARMQASHTTEKVLIPGPCGSLEGVLDYREDRRLGSGVLLCSPHPHFAGTLDNNVLRHISARVARDDFTALRFNYRGVEGSAIQLPPELSAFSYWQGIEERVAYGEILGDARSAARYLEAAVRPARIRGLVGYSFGAIIAAALSVELDAMCRVVLVAPPLRRHGLEQLAESGCRVTVVTGSDDFVHDRSDLDRIPATKAGACDVLRLSGCDHFFRGDEDALAAAVSSCLLGDPS